MDLHNDHNVYILGAGFSREAGLPLVSDFLIRMRDGHQWLSDQGRHAEAESIKRVLEFRLAASNATYWTQLDLENIEELFSLAASMPDNLQVDIQHAIAATLDYCAAVSPRKRVHTRFDGLPWLMQQPWAPTSERGSFAAIDGYAYRTAKLLGMFVDGTPKGENTFITFNYDTQLEDALERLGVRFGYGLPKRSADFDASVKAVNEGQQVNVLKLHGSINWGRRKKKGRSLALFGSYQDLRGAGAIPELVPPTWRKHFQDQLASVWDAAVQALSTATRVAVIGFSLPPADAHFKYLLAAGLRSNVSLRTIDFFNPDRKTIEDRVRDLLRVQYIDSQLIRFHEITVRTLSSGSHLDALNRPFARGASESGYGDD